MKQNLLFFEDSGWTFCTFSGKVRQSFQNCILRSLGIFWGKKLFEALDNVPPFFGLWAEKVRPLVKKFSLGLSQVSHARAKENFEISFISDMFCFLYHSGVLATNFLSLGKKNIQVCQNTNQRAQRKNVQNNQLRKNVPFVIFRLQAQRLGLVVEK